MWACQDSSNNPAPLTVRQRLESNLNLHLIQNQITKNVVEVNTYATAAEMKRLHYLLQCWLSWLIVPVWVKRGSTSWNEVQKYCAAEENHLHLRGGQTICIFLRANRSWEARDIVWTKHFVAGPHLGVAFVQCTACRSQHFGIRASLQNTWRESPELHATFTAQNWKPKL